MPRVGQKIEWHTGVYRIDNSVNGKFYVGSAAHSFDNRKYKHWGLLRRGIHPNNHLQSAWNLYGEVAFSFVVIEQCSPAVCLDREQVWLDLLKPFNREIGYNKSPTATGSRGVVWSEESRARLSAAKKGTKLSTEAIAKRTEKQKGLKRTAETKARMSEAIRSSEAAKAAAKARIGSKLSDETRAKIAAANTGHSPSQADRASMARAQRLRFLSSSERTAVSLRKFGNRRKGKKNATHK